MLDRSAMISYLVLSEAPNGLRYPLVGGTRQRHFDGTNSKPRNLPENAQTPTSRVHALLGGSHNPGIYFAMNGSNMVTSEPYLQH